jgi:putative hemolysin
MTTITFEIAIIVVLTIINGVFSMSEVALLSVRTSRLQRLAERGDGRARRALVLLEDPNNFLSTVQIGVTLVGVLSGAFGGATIADNVAGYLSRYSLIAPYAGTVAISIVVLAITYLSLVIGELVPKRIALHNPEKIARMVAGLMSGMSRIGAPVVTILSISTNAVLAFFGLRKSSDQAVTEEDVRGLLHQGAQAGIFEPGEYQIVERVFQFADRRVSAMMTPRGDIVWLDVKDSYSELRTKITASLKSRFPVCDGDLDSVLGILHAKDFLAAPENADVRSLSKHPVVVPQTMPALKVLEQFRQTTVHIALAVDEYGSVRGLVSATDILEALVGELPDEIPHEHSIVRRSDGSWLVDGTVPIEDLKGLLGVAELPGEGTGKFQTVAGFIMDRLGKVPATGEQFVWEENRFEVVDMDGKRVDKVLVVPQRTGSMPVIAE